MPFCHPCDAFGVAVRLREWPKPRAWVQNESFRPHRHFNGTTCFVNMEYAPLGLIGLLTPQANTTVEPEAWALLPKGYSLINARLVSPAASLNQRLLDYVDQLESSLLQFANAPVSVLSLACTGSSYLMGREQESRWVDAWQARLNIPVVTAGVAVATALKTLGVRRLDLLSPYDQALTQASMAYWISHGFEIGKVQSLQPSEPGFHAIYTTSSESTDNAAQALGISSADAVLMLGTGMPTLKTLLAQRNRTGPPWLSSMLALIWQSIAAIPSSPPEQSDLQTWLNARHWADRAQAMGIAHTTT
jgi:maleate isomerase